MKTMAELQLVLALGRTLALDTPDRKAVWDDLRLSVANGQLLKPSLAQKSPGEVHGRLHRALMRGHLPDDWIEVAERALIHSPADWTGYISVLGAQEAPALTKIEKLLRLRTSATTGWSPPVIDSFLLCIESFKNEWPESLAPANSVATPAPMVPLVTAKESEGTEFLTQSQQGVLKRMTMMATLYFFNEPAAGLRPRFTPLLIGPTGSGKTAVVKRITKAVDAHLMRVTLSEWVPNGAREETSPTLRTLVTALLEHERMVLFIDELDKISNSDGTWNRSCLSEIFDVLERNIPKHLIKSKADQERLTAKIRDRLLIVGAGTWSHLQSTHGNTRPMGFSASRAAQPAPFTTDIVDRALKEGFPAELFGRFHNVPFFLNYPEEHETAEILNRLGLVKLATSSGRSDLIRDFTWKPFGLRNLESLYADLLVARHAQAIPVVVDMRPSKVSAPSSIQPSLAVD